MNTASYHIPFTTLRQVSSAAHWHPILQPALQCVPVCTKRPPATTGVAWSECRHVLVGVKCQGYCQPGYTGPGAHTKCTAQGWSTPISSCVSKNKAAPAPVKVKQPQPPSPAGTPPAMSKQQAPRQQLPKTCSQAPPRVPGAKWARDCTNLAAGQSCSAYCGTGRPALAGYSARCNSNGIWSRPTGPGCSGLNPAKAKATMAAAAAAAAAPVRTGGAQVMLLEAATARNQADDAAPAKCAGNPPAVAGAVWQGCPGLEEGFGCLAQCTAPGMRGSYSALCGLGGVWQAAVSGCEQMTCSGSPKAVEGAVWPDCSGYLPGDQCVASGCSSGYIGQGYVANCMLDGSWGDVWGDCRKPGTVINTESGGNHL